METIFPPPIRERFKKAAKMLRESERLDYSLL
jgi:hypothetical protein